MQPDQTNEGSNNHVIPQIESKNDRMTKREALMAILEPYEQALFRLLEHLAKIEQQAEGKPVNEPIPQIKWDGWTTQQLIDRALDGQYLPLSFLNSPYKVVGWQYGINRDHPDYPDLVMEMSWKQKYDFIQENHRGTSDLRIIPLEDGSLVFSANTGRLKGMGQDFKAAFDQEPYPVRCEDYYGFRYENPAYMATHPKQK
jgi:hypothetical protein